MTGPGMPLGQFRFGAALGQDPGVIGALILAFNLRQEMIRLRLAHAVAFAETIGQGKEERDDGRLVIRIGRENIETDAFRFARLVQQPIALGLLQRGRDGFLGKMF